MQLFLRSVTDVCRLRPTSLSRPLQQRGAAARAAIFFRTNVEKETPKRPV